MVGSFIQQFLKVEAISTFQGPYLYSQPFLTLGVFQDLALELFQGVRIRSELLRVDGRQHHEGLFQPGDHKRAARLEKLDSPAFLGILQQAVEKADLQAGVRVMPLSP